MRKLLLMAVAACLLLMGGQVRAADTGTAPAVKIGVVDMQTVATQSEPAQAAKAQMESKFGKERANLEKQGEALKKKAESLKNPKISEEKKLDFIRAKQELDQKTRNFLRKVEQEEVKLRQDMVTLVFSATYEVARAKGFNFVVDVTAGGVLYADQSMDLTKEVLAEVNKLYKEKTKDKDKGKEKEKK
ncbi:MAG: OmpH family outer membrane protein [Desulfovibrio sp.]|nr:OmpH family outer membrane protein [Desulfovibrio sp.]